MAKNKTSIKPKQKLPGRGRPKGSPNKINAAIRMAISNEFNRRKQSGWLKTLPDDLFVSLVKHIVPKPVELTGAGGQPLIVSQVMAEVSVLSEELPDYEKA